MKSENPGMTAAQLLSILNTRKLADRFNFYDEFNRAAEDTDVWTSGGDAGTFLPEVSQAGMPTAWSITTGNVIDNDEYLQGNGVDNRRFNVFEEGYTTVTWETRVKLLSIADISAFFGMLTAMAADYAEPATSITFFADPAVTNTFRARSHFGAEEETDTLLALDTDFHTFKIVWTATRITFFIDDALVATHLAQIPDRTLMSELLIRTEAAATKSLIVDYVRVELS